MSTNLISFPADKNHVRVGGRSLLIDGVRYCDYTCSFVEFEMTGTFASAELISDLVYDDPALRAWAAVFIDGKFTEKFVLSEKITVKELFRSDKPRKVIIRIMKLSEAAFAKMGIKSISIDGELLPPPAARSQRRIEFVGDSITCGYGIDGTTGDTFSTATENPLKGYAYKTAQKCRAEYQLVSWSGIGVYSSWVEETAEKPLDNWLMKDIYPYTDSYLEKSLGKENHTEHTPYNFSEFVPQIIVFNIGTNDQSWTKTDIHRQQEFGRAFYEMLEMIRSSNPLAHIVCAYGVMGDVLCEEEKRQIKRFSEEHDDNIAYIPLPLQQENEDGIGVDWHPSEKTHEKMSDILSEYINSRFAKNDM